MDEKRKQYLLCVSKSVKLRLRYYSDYFTDDELVEYLNDVLQKILNYINHKDLPAQLECVLIDMSVDYLRHLHNKFESDNPDAEIDMGNVSALSIGDTQISFGGAGSSVAKYDLKSHIANLDDLLMNYREQLNMFRRMRW